MFEFAANIRPLLLELDELIPYSEPVEINVLIALTRKHSAFKNISLTPTAKKSIAGAHVAFPETGTLLIFYHPCGEHRWGEKDRECPECRWERFIIAKELSHAFDCEEERTTADQAEETLIKECLTGSYSSKQAQADLFGSLWGVELLMRYQARVELTGAGALAENPRLTSARKAGDFSYFAAQFCIPPKAAENGLRENVMKAMRAVRQHAGLPIFVPFNAADYNGGC